VRVSGYGNGGWDYSPADLAPLLSLLLFSILSLPTLTSPCNNLVGCLGVLYLWLVCSDDLEMAPAAGKMAEFQTPTVFDCNFNSNHSELYSCPKIFKLITYILSTHKNAFVILF
jgi:hypothetical protein